MPPPPRPAPSHFTTPQQECDMEADAGMDLTPLYHTDDI